MKRDIDGIKTRIDQISEELERNNTNVENLNLTVTKLVNEMEKKK